MAKLWTVDEVAEYWGVSKWTIFRLIHANKLAAISVGKSYRIPNDAVASGASKS